MKPLKSNSDLTSKMNCKLVEFRSEIDVLDRELMSLLIRRMSLSKEIAAYKLENDLPIRDRNRELELIADRVKDVEESAMREALTDVLESVLKASRDIQRRMQDDQK